MIHPYTLSNYTGQLERQLGTLQSVPDLASHRLFYHSFEAISNMATTYILGSINESCGSAYHDAAETHTARIHTLESSSVNIWYPQFTWSRLWFSLLCLFVVLNIKNMPFIWHMRILNAFRFILRTQRPSVPLTPGHIFQPIITTSSAQLMEIDFNMHKSNSSYFADVDIARTHLVCTLFAKGIETMRGGTAAYTGSKQPLFGLALGAVSCNFNKEVRPYEQYEMWSKILTWDEKWVYIVTHFVRPDVAKPRQFSLYPHQSSGLGRSQSQAGGLSHDKKTLEDGAVLGTSPIPPMDEKPSKPIFATALSKCVFKSGRKTVSPELMLQMSGLLPTDSENGSGGVSVQQIEAQRQKGFEMAQALAARNQQNLEAEFAGNECEALGRHTDGAGIMGVANTLMQLAHLKKSQLL
ncbi:hypothetical protein F5Y15DRAFT_402918 [Xylariaceae sp. FL0016]|nr:hypothetical protein F5Y15DRAFT_402918 [Xylariaceae sp. FL0016]